AMDHDKSAGNDLSLNIPITVTVTDSDGDSRSGSFNVTVYDDTPQTWHHPDNAHVPNEAGDQVTGNLHLTFGADGPADNLALQLGDSHGTLFVNGQAVVDDQGHALTSGGHDLVYMVNDTGGVDAVYMADGTEHVVFSVNLDAEHKTYTVTMGDYTLDPQQTTTVFSADHGLDASNNFQLADGITAHVTGTYDGNAATVAWDANGVGVDSAGTGQEHLIGPNDALTMQFQDGSGHAQAIDSLQVTLTGLGVISDPSGAIPEQAEVTLYLNGQQVYQGAISGVSGGQVDFNVHDLYTGSFDTIVFGTADKESTYQVKSLTVDQANYHPELSYTVLATDSDGDTAQTGAFHVTFNSADSASGTEHGYSGADAHHQGSVFDSGHGGHGGGGEAYVGSDSGGGDMHDHHALDHLVGSVGHHH
ncbi:MAG: hypothetical protein FWD79_08335, partial [Desulfobulbus sp.]|nr:hypothetical protein [Desulfobulbus sp.]